MDPTKPITGGELLDMYAERIETLKDALAAYVTESLGGPSPSAKQREVGMGVARELDALPERPLGA